LIAILDIRWQTNSLKVYILESIHIRPKSEKELKMTREWKMHLWWTFVITLAFTMVSCFGGVRIPLSKQNRNLIKCITIDPEIPQPETPVVQGDTNIGTILMEQSAIYTLATVNSKTDAQLFKEYLDQNRIDISKIVFDGFSRVIQEENVFDIQDNCSTKLKLVINGYGFGAASAFKLNDRKPMLYVTASLITNDSKVIWEKAENVTTISDADVYTFDQLIKNPDLTVKSLEQITDICSRLILADLKQ
jgi:hypothetical protein